jgi:type II restriction/modification system DNA methylase subunit YeeA
MTPNEFISKWQAAELKERSAAQEHFLDLCHLLGEPTPAEADPKGDWYCFERGASKAAGGEGWADVWKRGHFGWEYKGKRKDLNAALGQLQQYALALENPPLLVVCDLDRFRIHTNWTNSVSQVHDFRLEDLRDASVRQKLKWAMSEPERLRPGKTRQALTEEAAGEFAKLAQRLRERGHDPQLVAHFINRLVFCMFAEDVRLLPNSMFKRMLDHALRQPGEFQALATDLFRAMNAGGRVGFERVEWFNGSLFDDDRALPLEKPDIELTLRAANLDWAEIDPSIFGTLFERGLDPDKRSQLGAHYTDRDKIMLIVEPVIIRPWLREWAETKTAVAEAMARAENAKVAGTKTKARNDAARLYRAFLDRLRAFRVLDPACGSGNFLNLALLALKDLEHRAAIEAEALGLPREFPQIGPASVLGIEINPYAAELARVSVWIGEIQWMLRNGFAASTNPILKPLGTIERRDALLNDDGSEAQWPEADAVIGNPPFLGSRGMVPELGSSYVRQLRSVYAQHVPRGADFVCYWFAKAWDGLLAARHHRAGLVATNSIAGGASREVIKPIAEIGGLFEVWRDEPWTVEGAAVRVAIVCFQAEPAGVSRLDDQEVEAIYSDFHPVRLGVALDLTKARRLTDNRGFSFQGVVPRSNVKKAIADKLGLPPASFTLPGPEARKLLKMPLNPNGRPNADVIVPYIVADDITSRPADRFIVDFKAMGEHDAALYDAPFRHIEAVRKHRSHMTQPEALKTWWQHWRYRPELRAAIAQLERYIVTPRVAKHRLFVWSSSPTLPDNAVVVVARDDHTTLGILHSRFHEVWSLRMCTWLGVGNDPRYTPTTTFETFPFPAGMTPADLASSFAVDPRAVRIAEAAKRLNELREAWLNPPDLVVWVPEVVPGYPDRILPKDDAAAKVLNSRTLTNLYNQRPIWLANAHAELDAAVAAAYGWPEDMSDDEVLARLFELNQERAAGAQRDMPKVRLEPRRHSAAAKAAE